MAENRGPSHLFRRAFDFRSTSDIEEDGWLLSHRATCLSELGRYREAKDAAKEAIRLEPDLVEGYFALISVTLKTKHYDETVEELKRLEALFQIEIDDVVRDPIYADFKKSPEFEEWIRSRSLIPPLP